MKITLIKTLEDELNIDVIGIQTFTQLNEYLRIVFPMGYKTIRTGGMTLFSDGHATSDKVVLTQE